MRVRFGSKNAIEGYRDPLCDDPSKVQYRTLEGERIIEFSLPGDLGIQESYQTVIGAMRHHIEDGMPPLWIESDQLGLQELLVSFYNISKNHQPKVWGVGPSTQPMPRGQLRTDAGKDFQARVMGDGPGSTANGRYAPASYFGITADFAPARFGQADLAGEITEGSLSRAMASWGHTNGSSAYTLTKTFTSDQNVRIAKLGVFNAESGGDLVYVMFLSAAANLDVGEQVQITEVFVI